MRRQPFVCRVSRRSATPGYSSWCSRRAWKVSKALVPRRRFAPEGTPPQGDFVVGNAEAMGESKAWGEDGDGAFKREGGAFGEEVGAGDEDVVGVKDEGGDGHVRLLVDLLGKY